MPQDYIGLYEIAFACDLKNGNARLPKNIFSAFNGSKTQTHAKCVVKASTWALHITGYNKMACIPRVYIQAVTGRVSYPAKAIASRHSSMFQCGSTIKGDLDHCYKQAPPDIEFTVENDITPQQSGAGSGWLPKLFRQPPHVFIC